MKGRVVLTVAGLAGAAVLVVQMNAGAFSGGGAPPAVVGAGAGQNAGGCTPGIGPDVIVGSLIDIRKWGTIDEVTGYSLGATSCNIGSEDLQWVRESRFHPVIAQNIYRLKDGRFEQIGLSWLKHGFTALTQDFCCTCNGHGGNVLGVGCSDPYSANLNGSQAGFPCGAENICGGLGPRFEVNASSGYFEYPYGSAGQSGDDLYKRIQVPNDDLDPVLNPGAVYYGEVHYVTADDAAAQNHHNNASYMLIQVDGFSAGGWDLSFDFDVGTVRELPALYAWQALDPEVAIEVLHVEDDGEEIDEDGDDRPEAKYLGTGRYHLGYRVTDNGNGTWHYEYALYNMNSHRSARALTVPVGSGVTVTDAGFHDVSYHSGDGIGGVNYDDTDWPVAIGAGEVAWSTDTFEANPNANALRWGTLYNFWFDADAPPAAVVATVGLFRARPGVPMDYEIQAVGPGDLGDPCPWDLDGDDTVGITDLLALLAAWGTDPGGPPDFNGDGTVGISDLLELLANWGACP
ncbi:MAG: hypothetical protein ACYS0G_10585 [Planctomycetota bacterium]|jgi:hypothetical protein